MSPSLTLAHRRSGPPPTQWEESVFQLGLTEWRQSLFTPQVVAPAVVCAVVVIAGVLIRRRCNQRSLVIYMTWCVPLLLLGTFTLSSFPRGCSWLSPTYDMLGFADGLRPVSTTLLLVTATGLCVSARRHVSPSLQRIGWRYGLLAVPGLAHFAVAAILIVSSRVRTANPGIFANLVIPTTLVLAFSCWGCRRPAAPNAPEPGRTSFARVPRLALAVLTGATGSFYLAAFVSQWPYQDFFRQACYLLLPTSKALWLLTAAVLIVVLPEHSKNRSETGSSARSRRPLR